MRATAIECIKKTIMRSGFKKEDGLIFRPSEKSRSSTPISDGVAKISLLSAKFVIPKQEPAAMKPTTTGKDKDLQIRPNIKAPVIQSSIVPMIPIYLYNSSD